MEAARQHHFGALLRQFRLDAGMTQQQLAERAKLSVQAISTLERGTRTRPYRETVLLLARALELSQEQEALLESAAEVAHLARHRQRIDSLNQSFLTIVRTDTNATPRHNLPQQLTSFVGRQNEIGEIATLLREQRLVTVVGAGGVGKTRIAVELGSELLDSSPDGVWMVDLAPLADQTLVAITILSALQLPSTTGSALDAVVAYLKTRKLMLILDNCEHMVAATREAAVSIVRSCPCVRILTTSREALDVQGEWVYRLPSMAVPSDSHLSAKESLRYGAVILFVERAHAINSSFLLVDDNAPDVVEICRRLDGIPLAIELAAARANVLSTRQIADRLDERFRLLTGGNAQGLPRHQTMTALIDWSYDLLTPREQQFFESLSVFAGSCTLEAATAVCGENELEVIYLITSLVTKSLLIAELAGLEQRYRLLESSRQYARAKLIARGSQEQLARRHAVFFLDLAERLDSAWDTTPEAVWLDQAKAELENWRAALDWALAKRGDAIVGQRLAATRNITMRCLMLTEGRHWVRSALELVNGQTPLGLVARLECAEAFGAQGAGEYRASLAAGKRALARYVQLRDAPGVARAQQLVGSALALLGSPAEAEPLLQNALEAAGISGDRRLRASALQGIGFARSAAGDFIGARDHFTEALVLANVLGSESFAGSVVASLAECEFNAGDAEAALKLTIGFLSKAGAQKSAITAMILANTAGYLMTLNRYDEAQAHAKLALERALEMMNRADLVVSLQHLAFIALLNPKFECSGRSRRRFSAASIFGFVDAQCSTLGISRVYVSKRLYDRAFAVLCESLDTADLTRLMAAGATMTEDEAVAQAQALE